MARASSSTHCLLALAATLAACLTACAAPAVRGQAAPSQTASTGDSFSHDDWRQVLERFVDTKGLVDYRGLAADRQVLDRYLESLRSTSPKTSPELFPTREAALAYYLNAYNAFVFNGILAKGPDLDSVWGWTGTGAGFFVGMGITVGGERTNLKKLEDDEVREAFQDPRVHAALNCASLGCPRLPREPFLGETLDIQLDAAMTEFVGRRDVVHLDHEARIVTLSKIFDWFEGDFLDFERRQGSEAPDLISYINRYRSGSEAIPIGYRVQFSPYDKGLNAQRR